MSKRKKRSCASRGKRSGMLGLFGMFFPPGAKVILMLVVLAIICAIMGFIHGALGCLFGAIVYMINTAVDKYFGGRS